MRIAVTYDNANGEVFQHFGKTEFFKIYETEDDKVVSSEVLSAASGMRLWPGYLPEAVSML